MLPELVAANAAYAIDRNFIVNGKEISYALARFKNLVGAEKNLKELGSRKKDGLFAKVMGRSADDFNEFLGF